MRLIDANALYRKVKTECNPYGKPSIGWEDGKKVMEWIENAPTVGGLLKEQEPARVADGRPRCRFECGNCGAEFFFVYNYCPACGRKVKWDATN